MRISLPRAFCSPSETRGGAHRDASASPQGGRQGDDTTTLSSALASRLCQRSCSRGRPLGSSGCFRAPRSTQEPKIRRGQGRLRRQQHYRCPAAPEPDPGEGRAAEGRVGGGPERTDPLPRRPPSVYLHAGCRGGTGFARAAAARAPERFPRAAGPAAQDVLSHAAPAAQLELLRDLALPFPSLPLTAP